MIQRERYLEKLRQLRGMNVIKIVTGVRRCGKSTLLDQFRRELKQNGVQDKNIITFNLEERENKKFLTRPDLLHDTILELCEKHVQNYVFIDEAQMLPEFERTIDSLFVKDDIDLYITGSNAYMTSSELATLLSGRYIEIKMQPFTFAEFMQFLPGGTDRTARFQQFMRYGGFPEVANFLTGGAANLCHVMQNPATSVPPQMKSEATPQMVAPPSVSISRSLTACASSPAPGERKTPSSKTGISESSIFRKGAPKNGRDNCMNTNDSALVTAM